jgi:Rieske Fe-S protein
MRRREVLGLLAVSAAFAGVGGPLPVNAAEARKVANLRDLSQPWASTEFQYRDGDENVPGILIALPNREIYGAALICTHGGCPLQYKTDVQEINNTYDVTVSTPALVCPCHLSVFDLARGGAVAGGPAPRAPRRFELTVRGEDILVTNLERL